MNWQRGKTRWKDVLVLVVGEEYEEEEKEEGENSWSRIEDVDKYDKVDDNKGIKEKEGKKCDGGERRR